jgi:GH35 family endo-1,4-beta-xylanase
MVAHIAVEAGRYKGAIYAWDVVNEPFTDSGSWRKSIWREAMGPDSVAIALKAARQADPEAKRYVNDYNVESDGPKMRATNVTTNLQVDGRTLASVVEKYISQNNRTVNTSSGFDGRSGWAAPAVRD